MGFRESMRATTLRELELASPILVPPETAVADVVRRMQAAHRGCALVVAGERLSGVFTERDVLEKIVGHPDRYRDPVGRYLAADPPALAPSDTVETAVARMADLNIRHLPVVGPGGRPLGTITSGVLVRFLVEHFPREVLNLPPRHDQVPPTAEGA
jgi:CBS domain-containing protein